MESENQDRLVENPVEVPSYEGTAELENTNHPESTALDSPVIRTIGLTKIFNDRYAVRDVNLGITRGQVLGLLGPKGSGKTTLIRLLTGYYQPTTGSVQILGLDPEELTEKERRKIGYSPQICALYPDLTVWENLNFFASLYGMSPLRRKKLRKLMETLDLLPYKNQLASKLSEEMQRCLRIATALIHDPEIIFLDEPTTQIHPFLKKKFWSHIQNLRNEGRTLLIATQDVSEAPYCDRVAVLIKGNLRSVDTPDLLKKTVESMETTASPDDLFARLVENARES